jgi:hypothetical protein
METQARISSKWELALAVNNYNIQPFRVIWPTLLCPKAVSNQPAPRSYQMDGNH